MRIESRRAAQSPALDGLEGAAPTPAPAPVDVYEPASSSFSIAGAAHGAYALPPAPSPPSTTTARDAPPTFRVHAGVMGPHGAPMLLPTSPAPRVETSAEISGGNDNLPAPLAGALAPPDRLGPRGTLADDDGRTFSSSSALTATAGSSQVVVARTYDVLTQDGALEDRTRDARTDLTSTIVQMNQRGELGPGVVLVTGLSMGAQTVGPQGGQDLQSWFHASTPFGGRFVGDGPRGGLQDRYTTPTTITTPVVGGAVGVEASTKQGAATFTAGASLHGTLALGPEGLSSAQAGLHASVAVENVGRVTASGFVASATGGPALSFAPLQPATLGWELRAQIDALRAAGIPVSAVVAVGSNSGGLGDTTYRLGFIVGDATTPWLDPRR